jgi:hypothetical protein
MPGAVGVSEEVVALLGAAAVARVSEPTGFRCMRCGIDGGVVRGDGASVVVMQFRDGARVVRLAHSGCAPSQIVEVAEDAPTPPSIEQDIKSLTLGVPSATGTRPVLLIQPDTGLGVVTPPGDIVDPWLAALFAVGWQMPQTVDRRPSTVEGHWLRSRGRSGPWRRTVGDRGQCRSGPATSDRTGMVPAGPRERGGRGLRRRADVGPGDRLGRRR